MMQKKHATIYLPYGEFQGGGFVTVYFDGATLTAEYASTKAELLLVLNRALLADEHLESVARGWRTPEQISAQLQYPIEEASLRKTISLMNRAFREAAAATDSQLCIPPLITTKRQIGIRLTWPLQVIVPEIESWDK
jgi:hypothetical protein